jgi:hypothetical protein
MSRSGRGLTGEGECSRVGEEENGGEERGARRHRGDPFVLVHGGGGRIGGVVPRGKRGPRGRGIRPRPAGGARPAAARGRLERLGGAARPCHMADAK